MAGMSAEPPDETKLYEAGLNHLARYPATEAGFAASRAKRLTRAGKSRRAALAHLAAKGVKAATAKAVVADDAERELGAACAFLRRRRAGPFGEADELKVLAAMGRGGFSQEVARRAMLLERDEAERLIKRLHE